jgi:hypothetical protein
MNDLLGEFIEIFGENITQEIFENAWNDISTNKIDILSRETLDREGGNIKATIQLNLPGKNVYIELYSGNCNGDEITFYEINEWTEEEKEREIIKAFYAKN